MKKISIIIPCHNSQKWLPDCLRSLREQTMNIDDLEFYAARHSWATIALNKCGIDKYTVHAALNHVDESMRVTDIYIERDFVNENKANAKVIKYVFGK